MRKIQSLFLYCGIFLFGILGCESQPKKVVEEVVSNKEMERVLEKVEKEDCLVLYRLFGGISEYCSRYPGVTKNSQAFNLFKVVKERYGKEKGWLDGPPECPNDIIEKELLAEGFDKPAEFTEESRQKFVLIFKGFEGAALKAYRSKK